MSLADRLANVVPEKAQCITCRWLAGLPERDQEAFAQLASRADISHAQLHRLCKEEGLPCSESAFKRHLQNCSGRESR